jgi:hypothetical protein
MYAIYVLLLRRLLLHTLLRLLHALLRILGVTTKNLKKSTKQMPVTQRRKEGQQTKVTDQ